VSGKFEIFALMSGISSDAPLLYRTLSGVTHHAPRIAELHMPPTRPDESGMYYGTQIFVSLADTILSMERG
jgi:hypothetical protein